jgi:hypothetical protein
MFAVILLGAVWLRSIGPEAVSIPHLGVLDALRDQGASRGGTSPTGSLDVQIEAVTARDLRVDASGWVDGAGAGVGSLWLVAVQRQVGNAYVGPVYLSRTPVHPDATGDFGHSLTMHLRRGLHGDDCDFLLLWASSAEAVAWLEDNQTGVVSPKWDGRWGPLHRDLTVVAKTTARVPATV